MADLFDTPRMAAGYARSRPRVHPHVISRIRQRLRITSRIGLALDVGCGAGLSTEPLASIADHLIGIDPSVTMLRWGSAAAPNAWWAAGAAEALPVRSYSADIVTASGSLNWGIDLEQFFREVARVLTSNGTLAIYDFSQGRNFKESDALADWCSEFQLRYPAPPCLEISPATLHPEGCGLRISSYEDFEVPLEITPDFYVDYVMTETGVEEAIRGGVPEQEIRTWCESTLAEVFRGASREILFRGYIAYLVRI